VSFRQHFSEERLAGSRRAVRERDETDRHHRCQNRGVDYHTVKSVVSGTSAHDVVGEQEHRGCHDSEAVHDERYQKRERHRIEAIDPGSRDNLPVVQDQKQYAEDPLNN
jgi:hypothetical protein